MAKVKIPTPLRSLTDNQTSVEIEGEKIINIIENLNQKFPGVSEKIMENNALCTINSRFLIDTNPN